MNPRAGLDQPTTVGRAVAARHQHDRRRVPDLRHTFSTWLEDAGIPARVIDELMGHSGGRGGGGEEGQRGSAIGLRYRWTTPEMEARVVAASEQRLAVSLAVAARVTG
jgi:integrase